MNKKNAIIYLKSIKEQAHQTNVKFKQQIQEQISKTQLNIQDKRNPSVMQPMELKIKLYQIFSRDPFDTKLQLIFPTLSQIIKNDHQLFLILCKSYPCLQLDLFSLIVQKVDIAEQNQETIKSTIILDLINSFDNNPTLLNQKLLYHLYLGLILYWVSQIIQNNFEDMRKQLPCLINKLSLLEQKFTKQVGQFEIITFIFWVVSLSLCIHDQFPAVRSSISEIIQAKQLQMQAQGYSNKFQLLDRTYQEIQNSKCKYYKTMERYSLLDPNFRIVLISHIKQMGYKKLSMNIVQEHIDVVISILKKHIFAQYQVQILHEICNIGLKVNENNGRYIMIIKRLLQAICTITLNKKLFLTNHKKTIFCMGTNQQLKKIIFMIYYNMIKNQQNIDKEILDFLVIWNTKLNIDSSNFAQIVKKQGFDVLSQAAMQTISCTNSQFSQKMFQIKLQSMDFNIVQIKQLKQFLGNNQKPYIYIVEILLNSLANIKPEICLKQFKKIVINDNIDKIASIKQQTCFILETAHKKQTFSYIFVKKSILLGCLLENQCIFGVQVPHIMDFYIRSLANFSKKQIQQFIQQLINIFLITATKLSLYLTLICLILYKEAQQDTDNEKKVYQYLEKIFNIHEKTAQHKIVGFSQNSLEAMIILTQMWSQNQKILQLCLNFLASWSSLYSRAAVQLIFYQFDSRLFQKILKSINMKLPILQKDRKTVIFDTLKLIDGVLQAPYCNKCYCISPYRNQIQLIPVQSQRNSLQLKLKVSINSLKNCCSFIQFISVSRQQKQISDIIKHKLIFLENKIVFQSKSPKQTLFHSQSLSVSRMISIRVKIAEKKFRIDADNISLFSMNFNLLIQKIRIQMNGDILFKTIECTRFENQTRVIDPLSNYCMIPGEIQIRMAKTSAIKLQQLTQKIPRIQFIAYFNQIFVQNSDYVSLGQFYNLCFSILIKTKDQKTEKKDIEQQKTIIYYFFHQMRSRMKGRKTYPLNFASIPQKLRSKQIYFDCLVAAYFNNQFFTISTSKLKNSIIEYVCNLIENNSDFFSIQNQNLMFFANLLQICQYLGNNHKDLLATKLLPTISYIIKKHKPNQTLLQKLKHFYFACKSTQLDILQQFFRDLMGNFFEAVTKKNPQGNQNVKYTIMGLQQFDIIFQALSLQTKHILLDYFLENGEYFSKIVAIIDLISDKQYLELQDWFICNCKRIMFEYFEFKQKDDRKFMSLLFLIECIIKLILKKQQSIQEQIKIITHFMNEAPKQNNNKKSTISKLCYNENFSYLIIFAITKLDMQAQQCSKQLAQMTNNCFKFLTACSKQSQLKGWVLFRKKASTKTEIFKYVYGLQCIYSLPVYSLSIFLQFTNEILILARCNLVQDSPLLDELCEQIQNFLQCLIKNYSLITKEPQKPLLYCYPKLQRDKNYEDKHILQAQIQELKKQQFIEMHGGIYFKMMCIILNLLEIYPNKDYSKNLDFMLNRIAITKKQQIKKIAAYRAVSDFSHVSREVKDRSSIQMAMKQLSENHQNYFIQNDQNIHSRTSNSRKSSQISSLNPYLVDFCLMRLSYYLQIMGNEQQQPIASIVNQYSKIFTNYILDSQLIIDDLNEKNVDCSIQYEDIEQLFKLYKMKEDVTVSDIMNSPMSRKYSNIIMHDQQEDSSWQLNNMNNFLTPPTMKKKRKFSINLGSGKKKRLDMIHDIEKNPKNWSKQPKKKKLHRYFANQTKIIWLKQLLHGLYTITSMQQSTKTFKTDKKKVMKFFKDYTSKALQINNQQCKLCKQILKDIQIRKVYPFTIKQQPVLKLKSLCFNNMASPLVKQSKKTSIYGNKKSMILPINNSTYEFNNEQLSNSLISTNSLVETQDTPIILMHKGSEQEYFYAFDEQEQRNNFENICQLSFRKGVYFCEYDFREDSVIFVTKEQKNPPHQKFNRIMKYGAPLSAILPIEDKKIQMKISDIHQIFYRKYNQIQNNSIELFFKNGSSFLIILYIEQRVNSFLKKCRMKYRQFAKKKIVKDYRKQFQDQGYSEKWCNGQISNFDYLMLINKYSGRTLADLNQYYIFPWVVQDYKSKELDLNNYSTFRNLREPIGALNKEKLQKYLDKYQSQSSQGCQKYLYGSHYSTSLFILHYLVRIEPFTSLHCEMQSGQFDDPNRIFSSICQMWECLTCETSVTDIKQAIPQFYYLPTFLENSNNLDMGVKSNGVEVRNVQLPPWAANKENFIHKMRACLQSDYVSLHLNNWIDLIFGKDQKNIQKYNLFHPLSYVQNIKPQKIKTEHLDGLMTQIFYFGQNPNILFTKQHPKKKLKLSSELFKSSNLKTMKSERLEEKLESNLYIGKVIKKKKNLILSIYQINKSMQCCRIELNMDSSMQTLLRSLQQRKNLRLSKLHSLQGIQLNVENSTSIQIKIQQSQVNLYMKGPYDDTLMKKIKIMYDFRKAVCNQTILIVYGAYGMRIYSWSMQLIKQIIPDKGEICEIYLESTHLFYLTSAGYLFLYDLCLQKSKQICCINQLKTTKHAQMYVFSEPKVPTKKNQIYYKFVLIGDSRHIVLLPYTFTMMKIN